MNRIAVLFLCILLDITVVRAGPGCGSAGVRLQVLGSGGPEITDQRASSAYLVYINGKARILVDMGGGSMLRFEQSGARLNDLDVVLFTHFHVDHTNDFPYLVKASYFTGRDRGLTIYGPAGNSLMPSADEFLQNLFGAKGAYRYLQEYLDGREQYRLESVNVKANGRDQQLVLDTARYRISAVPVHHGPIPALAWRVDIAGYSIVFSGDMNNDYGTLVGLARNANLLVAHHAIPESATGVARNLHMPPSVIGQIAKQADVRHLVLSHRMNRTLGLEKQSRAIIARYYQGPVSFADDLQCF